MPKKELPRFVVYQSNPKEFHICLEVKSKFIRWCSYYVPSMDIRFPREITKISDIASSKLPSKKVFDQGTYSTNKSDAKESVEKKVLAGIKSKSFAFILNGDILKGRFAIKKVKGGEVIQKFQDKYAVEEDVLSGDLSRTISTMIPDYDESKVELHPIRKTSKREQLPKPELTEELEEITADKTIGNTGYHFAFYTSHDEPDICLVKSEDGDVLVFQKQRKQWMLLLPMKRTLLKWQQEFFAHIKALSDL